jgi:hypothetical protein
MLYFLTRPSAALSVGVKRGLRFVEVGLSLSVAVV